MTELDAQPAARRRARRRARARLLLAGAILAATTAGVTGCASDPAPATPTAHAAPRPADNQLAYALAHWKSYNTAQYGDLNPAGGDCANFVSQTLIARGWQMNDQWYNHGAAADWSPAWGYVPSMDNYFRENATQLGLTEYSFNQRSKIKVGDIVMFDWNNNDSLDHVQIVSAIQKVKGRVKIKMAGHNEDTEYRDLDNTITVEHPGAVGHFWNLSK